MINVASIRDFAQACPGENVGLTKAQLAQLLDEVERGQSAQRQLQGVLPTPSAGIDGVSPAG